MENGLTLPVVFVTHRGVDFDAVASMILAALALGLNINNPNEVILVFIAPGTKYVDQFEKPVFHFDVGGMYDKRNFDHHQFPDCPSAVMLVYETYVDKLAQIIPLKELQSFTEMVNEADSPSLLEQERSAEYKAKRFEVMQMLHEINDQY